MCGDRKLNKALVSGCSTRAKERLFIVTNSSRRTRNRSLWDCSKAGVLKKGGSGR